MPRKRFTNGERLRLVALARERQAQGESLRSICRDFGIQPNQMRLWRANEQKIASSKRRNQSISRGRQSSIGVIEAPLLDWFKRKRENGHPVTMRLIILKAETLLPGGQFAERSWHAKYHCIRRLLRANRITLRVGRHVSERRTSLNQA